MKFPDPFSTGLALILLMAHPAFAVHIPNATFTAKELGTVVFDHNFHIRQKRVGHNCTACHDAIFDMRRRIAFTMADMAEGKSCGTCHDGRSAFGLRNCAACHAVGAVVFRSGKTGRVTFGHRRHARRTPCTTCHAKLYVAGGNTRVGMARMKRGRSCGACHDGRTAFAVGRCVGCHPIRAIRYRVNGLDGVTFSHSGHLALYSCGRCHPDIFRPGPGNRSGTMAAMERGTSCGACHDGKSAFTVRGNCDRCHAPVRGKAPSGRG